MYYFTCFDSFSAQQYSYEKFCMPLNLQVK